MAVEAHVLQDLGQAQQQPVLEVVAGHEFDQAKAYEAYRLVLSDVINASPQFQGFTDEEHAKSMLDSRTLFSTLRDEQQNPIVALPQLVPVDEFEWLNTEHYDDLFPSEPVMHFTAYEGVNPDQEVLDGLDQLAEMEGVLVFDFPDALPGYEERVKAVLTERGITVEEEKLLGTQTYYAGKVTLKNGYDPEKPIIDFNKAFQRMEAEGKINQDLENGATYTTRIEPEQAMRLYSFYEKAFKKIEAHPCRQGLTPEEFLEVVADMQSVAKLQAVTDGEAETVCVLGSDLKEWPWLHEEFFGRLFPKEVEQKQVLYFPALATNPEGDGHNTIHIVNMIAEMVEYANNEIVVAFDCCTANKGFLDVVLESFINATPQANITFKQIGEQQYKSFRLKKSA